MTTLLKLIVTAIVSSLLFSCSFNCISGQGEVTTEEHQLESFDQVAVTEGWDAVLIKGNESKLVVTANENLQKILDYSIEEGTLRIGLKENCILNADSKTVKVYYQNDLKRIMSSSGSEVVSKGIITQEKIAIDASSGSDIELWLDVKSASAEASSGSNIELEGISKKFSASSSSGSEIEAKELESEIASADASSGSEITLTANKEFTGEASSGGEVGYYGNPKIVTTNDSSGGDVNKL